MTGTSRPKLPLREGSGPVQNVPTGGRRNGSDPKSSDKGGEQTVGVTALPSTPNEAALDVLRIASGLGGLLVVALVTPVGASCQAGRRAPGPREVMFSRLRSKAEQREAEAAARQQQSEDSDRAVVKALADAAKAQSPGGSYRK
jgi:hypothetical protein